MSKPSKDLLVLLTDRFAGRAYIQYMVKADLQPAHILFVRWQAKAPGSPLKKAIYNLLPQAWVKSWRRRGKAEHEKRQREALSWVKADPGFDPFEPVQTTMEKAGLAYTEIFADTLNDQSVVDAVAHRAESHVLFTGGGLLRKPMFACGKKFIHLHPGDIPKVKGSGGISWSMFLCKHATVSCFYMTPVIDEGNLIYKQDFEFPVIDIPRDLKDAADVAWVDDALALAFDCPARAKTLMAVLSAWNQEARLPDLGPAKDDTPAYHVLHPLLRAKAYKRFSSKVK